MDFSTVHVVATKLWQQLWQIQQDEVRRHKKNQWHEYTRSNHAIPKYYWPQTKVLLSLTVGRTVNLAAILLAHTNEFRVNAQFYRPHSHCSVEMTLGFTSCASKIGLIEPGVDGG